MRPCGKIVCLHQHEFRADSGDHLTAGAKITFRLATTSVGTPSVQSMVSQLVPFC